MLKFAVCVFVVYVVYMLVQQQFDIKSREQELIAVQQQVEDKRLENKEIERLLESDNEQYVERLAKDEYGYAYPDETVYIDTSGN
ncbi:FtsB family cell division protein [Ligaoa zhengdingensis]|uniref:FtsB family cell division protein n=1 Tax=Ligaoa zhengdingensis TaxID=2763658 RepID=UPI0031B9E1AB